MDTAPPYRPSPSSDDPSSAAGPPSAHYDVAIASSWRQRDRVRAVAQYLRDALFISVFDFSDASQRPGDAPELPPEAAPLQWAPGPNGTMCVHTYSDTPLTWTYAEYLRGHRPGVAATMAHNRAVYGSARVLVLLLPAGCDAHFDAGLAVGRGAALVVYGYPPAGERVPSHLAARAFVTDGLDALAEAVRPLLADDRPPPTPSSTCATCGATRGYHNHGVGRGRREFVPR